MKFTEAYEKLKGMAAGKPCVAQVEQSSYAGVQLGVYIEDIGWGYGGTWQIAFLALEAKIRALDSADPAEVAAGVDEVVNGGVAA